MLKADDFTEVTKRNALRREAKLPLLDVRSEMAHMANVAAWKRWNELHDEHAAVKDAIRDRILTEYRDQGRTLSSVSGHWLLGARVNEEFTAYLRGLGHVRPPLNSRTTVVYGSSSRD